ncbi:diguanylate cyclase [Chitinispirillum alkaliphilum]|nr:diguanylate cyclase [Chitinispirillum alkaliphilum]
MKKSILSVALFSISTMLIYLSGTSKTVYEAVKISPQVFFVLIGLVVAACVKFNKSRISFILLLLLLWFFKENIPLISNIPQNEFIIFFSFNVSLLVVSNERGVLSVHGAKKTAVIAGQLILLYIITFSEQSFYFQSQNRIVRAIHYAFNNEKLFIPFAFMFVASSKNIFTEKNPALAATTGCILGFILLFLFRAPLTEITVATGLLTVFIGLLLSIHTTSYTDELTSLPGRRAYNEYTATLGSKYTIAMADIDHFKKFNDTHGHDTGDEVLKMVAKLLSEIGGSGKAFRFGGEEFVLVFNGKLKEQTAEHLEAIRKKISETPLIIRKKRKTPAKKNVSGKNSRMKRKSSDRKTLRVTISLGAEDSSNDKQPEKVMKNADIKLYKSKKAGRNRVTI